MEFVHFVTIHHSAKFEFLFCQEALDTFVQLIFSDICRFRLSPDARANAVLDVTFLNSKLLSPTSDILFAT